MKKENKVMDMAIASIINNGKINNEMLIELIGTMFAGDDALRTALYLTGGLMIPILPEESFVEYDCNLWKAKLKSFNFWEDKVYFKYEYTKTRYFKNEEEAKKFEKDGYLYGKDCKPSSEGEYTIKGTYSGESDSYCSSYTWLEGVK